MSLTSRELQSMGPKTDYVGLLQKEFNVEVPESAPKYQAEYLYKYARDLESTVSADVLLEKAMEKANALFVKYPWVAIKYDELDVKNKKTRGTHKSSGKGMPRNGNYADGTYAFCTQRSRFVVWVGGVHVASAVTLEKLTVTMTKKFPAVTLVEMK